MKINALNILRRELDPSRRRKPMPRGFMLPGGGVGDSYQPLEEKYQLTRGALKIMLEFGWPVHILTKSTLVERDLDLLLQLNRQQRVIVSFSFSSVSDKASAVFEPGVPPPSERLATISRLRAAGITCGMCLMPVIPFITDTPIQMDRTIRKAKEAGVRFIVFGGMTLKEGRQKDHFMNCLEDICPQLLPQYDFIYPGNKYGQAISSYYVDISRTFCMFMRKYKLPAQIPPFCYQGLLTRTELVILILEQIETLTRLRGGQSRLGAVARNIAKLNTPLSPLRNDLYQLKNVGPTSARLIREILDTGKSELHQRLLYWQD